MARGGRRAQHEALALCRSRNITLNKAAYDALGSPRYVEILVDKERRKLRLRPVDHGNGVTYTVTKQKAGAIIGFRSAWKALDLPTLAKAMSLRLFIEDGIATTVDPYPEA